MANLMEPPALNLQIPSDPGGAALGAASHAYAAGLQFASALKDQALRGQQQQQLQQHQAQQDQQKADDQNAKVTEGYLKLGGYRAPQFDAAGINGTPGQPTLSTDNHNPVDPRLAGITQDDFHLHKTPKGQAYYVPDQTQLAATKQKTADGFIPSGKLKDALDANGVQTGPSGSVPWATLHELMQDNGLASKPETYGTPDTQNFAGPDGPTTVQMSNQGNSRVVKPPAGVTQNPQTAKGASQEVIQGGRGANGGLLMRDLKSGEITEQPLPDGATLGLTAEQQAVAGRSADARADRNQRASEAAEARADAKNVANQAKGQTAITAYQAKEDAAHKLREQIGLALSKDNGENVIDPTGSGDKTEVEMTPARRAFLQNQFNAASNDAERNYGAKQKIITATGGEAGPPLKLDRAANPQTPQPKAPPAQQQQQTPAPAAPPAQQQQTPAVAPAAPEAKPLAPWNRLAKPTATQSKGKLTDQGKALEYVKKAGGDKARARTLAKADGWEF
jgi:hypothetical protein